MISIIIPTLNEEKYIGKLLISLAKQDYLNFEVIIADASSEDMTKDVAEIYAQHLNINMRFIPVKIRNASMQRNIGARAAFGEKLVFIDADIIIPNRYFLKKINNILKRNSCAAVPVWINPSEARFRDKIFSHFLNGFMMILNSIGVHNGRGAVIGVKAAEFWQTGGFDEQLAVAEDVDLFRKIGKLGNVGIMNNVVYESSRRYRELGYIRLLGLWVINGIWAFLFRKSYNTQWDAVR
ncbi:MAG: glycosyltransferase [Nanoarchaeota archaeon]|nr:glycosyltransferase [Nanoarchaeota archaeon]